MALLDLLTGNWTRLGVVSPDSLVDARLNAHWALQVVASAGNGLLEKTPDDAHAATEWLDRAQSLVGEEVPGGFRAALRLRDLQLRLLDKEGGEFASFNLSGRTLNDGAAWLADQLQLQSGSRHRPDLKFPDYKPPDHPAGKGEPFKVDSAALGELARWFANADRALQLYASWEKHATRVRSGPDHFDVTTLVRLGRGRTITVGMSPGDSSCRQPYFYARPSPVPEGDLPALKGGGVWGRSHPRAAVLTGSKLAATDSPERQVECLTAFLKDAIAACRKALA